MKTCVIFLVLLLSGCAYPTKKELFEDQPPSEEMAVVYVYRSPTSIDSVNPAVPRFFVNDKKIGRLSIGGYYRVLVKPGETTVTYKDSLFGIPFFWNAGEVKFTTHKNKSYFVKFAIEGILRIEIFRLVPNYLGKTEIKRTRRLVN